MAAMAQFPEIDPDRTSMRLHRPLRAFSDWLRRQLTPPPAPEASWNGVRGGQPSRIGRYVITGKLGEGGMGVVYSAYDEQLGRAIAVKAMSSLGGGDTARKRFWREARAAASINHPNVCQLYEVGEERGRPFIAMERLEGETLTERLRRGPLSLEESLPIGLGMLAALQALHSRGIVHRDLKPSNMFLTRNGVKLLDFGLARTSDPDLANSLASISELTRTGMLIGTPRYMSPEQVTGEGLDARSDLFAVGAILYEMLGGRPAFAGKNAVEILHATLYEEPPPLDGFPAAAAADRVIRRALSRRPAERPGSAAAMAEELRALESESSTDPMAELPKSPPDGAKSAGESRDERLDSWKEIAAHLQRGVRTVQRWEKEEGLPVHRHLHDTQGSVFALKSEIDAWWTSRPAPEAAPVTSAPPVDLTRRILIVDDSPSQRLLLRSMLKAEGHDNVVVAESAHAAFEQLGLDRPQGKTAVDLVLLDLSMPEMGGLEACRRIKADERLRDIPVIVVTASTEPNDLEQAFEAGAIDYVTKPPSTVELMARVRSALRLKQEMDRRKLRERELLEVSERLKAANTALEARIEEQLAKLRLAAQIQANLLPKAAPSIDGYEIAGKTIPAQMVGGDYFDFIAMDDSRWAICMADVSGKGLPASLLMANLQATIRGQTLVSSSASECVGRCNQLLHQSVDMGRYATLFYAILDPASGELRYCNAGHKPPMVFREGKPALRLERGGPALGILKSGVFEEGSVTLQPADVLVAWSDGITEATGEDEGEFGEPRLQCVVSEHQGEPAFVVIEEITAAVDGFLRGSDQGDDMTLVVVRRR
jgi:serine phosphatase RsbU (regulator of sigma subunit)/serine/threonine protein kinase